MQNEIMMCKARMAKSICESIRYEVVDDDDILLACPTDSIGRAKRPVLWHEMDNFRSGGIVMPTHIHQRQFLESPA